MEISHAGERELEVAEGIWVNENTMAGRGKGPFGGILAHRSMPSRAQCLPN